VSDEVASLRKKLDAMKAQRAANVQTKNKCQQQMANLDEQRQHLTQILAEKQDQLREEAELLTMLQQTGMSFVAV
jgi:septal ring factor EnvC (AmiA/AmiB activator)